MPRTALVVAIVIASFGAGTHSAVAEDKAAEITRDAQAALASLYAKVPKAKELGAKAVAVLVFPNVTKAGLGIGGRAARARSSKVESRPHTTRRRAPCSACRPGGRTYGYAMFFMNEKPFRAARQGAGSNGCRTQRCGGG